MTAPKKLGFWMCMALVMGNMIGSGVFLLPASLAPYGWDAVAGWGFTVAGVLAIVYAIGRLTVRVPGGNGPHSFVDAAFGPMPAFLVTWSYWISNWVGNAALATAAISYLSIFAPAVGRTPGLSAALTIALVIAVTLVNLRGARSAGGFQLVTTLLKLIPLAVVISITLLVVGRSHGAALAPFPAAGFSASGVTASAALCLWAMTGFETASMATGQIDNAETTVPRATMAGASATGLIYLIACSGIALLLPAAIATTSNAPFADFVARFWGPGPAAFVAVFAAISAVGALNGITLVQGEIPLALARAGSLPAWFGVTDAKGTPVRSLIVSSALTCVLVLLNASSTMTNLFTFLALLSTSASLFLYLGVSAASLRLGVGGAIGVVAIGFSLWTLWGAGIEATGWSSVLLLAGVPVFLWMRARRTRAFGGQP